MALSYIFTNNIDATYAAQIMRWSLTDPSGRPLLADSQRSNRSKASQVVAECVVTCVRF